MNIGKILVGETSVEELAVRYFKKIDQGHRKNVLVERVDFKEFIFWRAAHSCFK